MRLTYRDAEVVKNIAVHKLIGVVVFVRRKKFTRKSIVDVRGGPQVEGETRRSIQTCKRTLGHAINEVASKSRDVQVGEFFFDEVDIIYTTVGSIAADNFVRFS